MMDGEDRFNGDGAPCNFPGSHWMDQQSMDFSDNQNHSVGVEEGQNNLTRTHAEADETEKEVALCLLLALAKLFESDTG